MQPHSNQDMPEDQQVGLHSQLNAIQRNYEHGLKYDEDQKGGDALVDRALEGQILPKPILAATIAVGDLMGDSYRGIKQILQENGLADNLIDTKAQDMNENIMRMLYEDTQYGGYAKGGAVVGALAEPIGLLMPIGKTKSVYKGIAAGAAMGAMYGATSYIDGNESRLANAAMAAILMGAGGGISSKFFNHTVGSKVSNAIESSKHLDEYNTSLRIKTNTKAKVKYRKTTEEVTEELETAAAMEGKKQSMIHEFRTYVDSVIQPVVDNVAKYTPKVAAKMRVADGKHHLMAHQWTTRVKPWQEFTTKGLNKEQQANLKKLLNNGGFNKATMSFIKQVGGDAQVANAKQVNSVMKDIMKQYKDVGYRINTVDNYFPTSVSDLEGLRKHDQGFLDKIYLKAQAEQKGKPLSEKQKAHIDERYFTNDAKFSSTSGSLKSRIKKEVKDDELGFYHNPEDALHFYIHKASEDIAKRDFFKSFGHKHGKDGLDPTGADIDDSIASLVEQIKKDVPNRVDQRELVKLLRSRFSADVHKTHKFVQALKNLSYAGTLGNFWSAMTQVGDLVFSFHKFGIADSVSSIFGVKAVSRADLGIEKAMAELQSNTQGITNKIADFAFKWSGFNKIDRFGKNVNINASLRHNMKLASRDPKKFVGKYGNHFGEDTPALINELQTMKLSKDMPLSDNVKLMLWNDLADTQPIGLSEMPQKYLDNPNGRIFYAYKTFALKQFNYQRNMWNDPSKNVAERAFNWTMFATAFVLANGSIDGFKAFAGGKDLDMEDKVFDNLVSLVGTSKYAVDKNEGLGGIILQGLAPVPLTQLGKGMDAVTSGKVTAGGVVNQLPLVGKINKEWDIF